MKKIAIIGTGIAGMGSAWNLRKDYDCTFFEKNNYPGGHTNTVFVDEVDQQVPIDTGFMVYNDKTYPNLIQLFKELNVTEHKTNMSFGVNLLDSKLEFGCSGLNQLFAQRKNLINPKHWQFVRQILHFFKIAKEFLEEDYDETYTLEHLFIEKNISPLVLHNFLIPMASSIWSTPPENILEYPATALLRFLENHGIFGVGTQLQWKTLKGGSRQYRDRILQHFKLNLNSKIISVERDSSGAIIHFKDTDSQRFDYVVIATQADQALKLLKDPSDLECNLLEAFRYNINETILHSDASIMPRSKAAWSSWNFRTEKVNGDEKSSIHYWMNSLQDLQSKTNYFVSLNYPQAIPEDKIHWKTTYRHVLFDSAAIYAQKSLAKLNQKGSIYFCGSYFRNGFHEDALSSSLDVVEKILEQGGIE